jgi:hypothetical protein
MSLIVGFQRLPRLGVAPGRPAWNVFIKREAGERGGGEIGSEGFPELAPKPFDLKSGICALNFHRRKAAFPAPLPRLT